MEYIKRELREKNEGKRNEVDHSALLLTISQPSQKTIKEFWVIKYLPL